MPYSLPPQSLLLTPQPIFFFCRICCFLFPLPTFPSPSLSSSFSTAQKHVESTAPSLPLVTVAFPSYLSQFLCTPHVELVVRADTELRGSSGEANEFAAIALGDQTYLMHVLNTHRRWQSEEGKAPIVFLSCSRLSQRYFRSLCFFCLKLWNSEEVSSYKRLLRKSLFTQISCRLKDVTHWKKPAASSHQILLVRLR